MQKGIINTPYKIAILYTIITALLILLLNMLVYIFTKDMTSRDFYKRLDIRAVMVAEYMTSKNDKSGDVINDIRNIHLEKLSNEQEYFKEIDTETVSSIRFDNLDLPETFYLELLDLKKATHENKNTFYAGVLYENNGTKSVAIVSAINETISQQLTYLRTVLFIGFIIATLILFILGYFFSKQIILPIKRMTGKVKAINTENLHLRLAVGKGSDEISNLARTFNNMLDRLETSFESQNNFVSNASHELSTPLTSIIGEAELALNKVRSQEDYRSAIRIILHDAERLKTIIQSLLNLAQTGFDGKKQNWEILRADELLLNAVNAVHMIYPGSNIHMDYSLLPEDDNKLNINGNENLLRLALTNIILNACKYSDNRTVTTTIGASNTHIFIAIKDKGIGIPESELPYIYDPFFRASNTGSIKGYGIGLPLARNIIRMHQGELKISSVVDKGTNVQISFPICKQQQPF